MIRHLSSAALLLLAVGVADAQSVGSEGEKAAGVQREKSFELSLGYARNYGRGAKNETYYKLTYLGNALYERGQMPTLVNVGSTPYLKDPREVDDFDLKIIVTDGVGSLAGPLADAVGLRPFDIKGDFFRIFRGKIQASGKFLDDQQFNVGAGLESINIVRFIPLLKDFNDVPLGDAGDPTKVLRIGVMGEKQSREKGEYSIQQTDTLQFTYRAYFGVGFDFHKTEARRIRDNALFARINGLTKEELGEVGKKRDAEDPIYQVAKIINAPTVVSRSNQPPPSAPPSVFDDPIETAKRRLLEGLTLYTFNQKQQPRFNFEARAEGSYAPVNFDVRRYNALYSIGLNLWIDPTRPDDGKITIGYQNGYNRGALTQPLTGWVATFGFRF